MTQEFVKGCPATSGDDYRLNISECKIILQNCLTAKCGLTNEGCLQNNLQKFRICELFGIWNFTDCNGFRGVRGLGLGLELELELELIPESAQ